MENPNYRVIQDILDESFNLSEQIHHILSEALYKALNPHGTDSVNITYPTYISWNPPFKTNGKCQVLKASKGGSITIFNDLDRKTYKTQFKELSIDAKRIIVKALQGEYVASKPIRPKGHPIQR